MIFKHTGLYIDKSPIHGWGVFISEKIKEGELIEESPVSPVVNLGNSVNPYFPYLMPYNLPESGHSWFIPTGYSIHLNHSNECNLRWNIDHESGISRFYATRDIKANEELFINYNDWKIQ